jgi:hypothetical protein
MFGIHTVRMMKETPLFRCKGKVPGFQGCEGSRQGPR